MEASTLLFYLFAGLAIAAGVAMVALVRSVVAGALALAVASISLAGLYLLLGAQLVAAAQLVVYLGAVLVLVVHARMLVGSDQPQTAPGRGQAVRALGVAAALGLGVLVATAGEGLPLSHELREGFGGHREIGRRLFGDLGLPLQLLGLLLLAAMLAASSLARGKESS